MFAHFVSADRPEADLRNTNISERLVSIDCAGGFCALDQRDHASQCFELGRGVARTADGGADVQLSNYLARRAGETAERLEDRYQGGSDAGLFDAPRDQTHGLMANRSRGHQQYRVDLIGK